MLTIHWLWLPLIITVALGFISGVLNGFKSNIESDSSFMFAILSAICLVISTIIYIGAGIFWLFTHISITS